MMMPADSYNVVNKTIITDVDKKIIIDLYQPIIGNNAVSLYFTLLNDLEKSEFLSRELTHHHLISVMQLSLNEINIAKEKLEGVGLLNTYLKKDHINNYIYVLFSPLNASEFLNHPILNVALYNNVGKSEYENIINNYKIPRLNLKDYENITHTFNDVFMCVSSKIFMPNQDLIIREKGNIVISNDFDFELLESGINKSLVNDKWLSKEIRELILKLSFIYDIDVLNMQNVIKISLNERGFIDKETLRKNCRNYYQYEHHGNLPSVIYRNQPEYLRKPKGDTSKRSKMIYTFENINPYYFIKSKYKDGNVTARDLKIVEDLLVDQNLTPGVVNVLIDYVLKINNKKLNRNYIEAVAGHWKRLGIETVEEAMNLCEKEHNKMKKSIVQNSTAKIKVKSDVPEWFDKSIEKEKVSDSEQKEMEDLLRNL